MYLDANATSRLRPEAREILSHLLLEAKAEPCNPSSVHGPGRAARAILRNAKRDFIHALLGDNSKLRADVIFTSGGSESCNQIIFGFLPLRDNFGRSAPHILTTGIEHPAVLEAVALLEKQGCSVTRVLPGSSGIVDSEIFCAGLQDTTALVSVMSANNETGAIQPVRRIAKRLREKGFHGPIVSDFCQALGKSRLSVAELFSSGVTAIALSAHKIGGPSGVGAVVYATDTGDTCHPLFPLVVGGPQQHGLRAGTENIPGIAAFSGVLRHVYTRLELEVDRRAGLREILWQRLESQIKGIVRLTPGPAGREENCISNTLLVSIPGCRGDDLVVALDLHNVFASTGSACASGKQGISHVMRAMGFDGPAARDVVRFSLDWDAGEDQLELASRIVASTVLQMRRLQSEQEAGVHVV